MFVARHATATCCRTYLKRWQGIPKGRELTADEQAYAVDVICRWIESDLAASGSVTSAPAGSAAASSSRACWSRGVPKCCMSIETTK